jgi:hypothetical protein
MRSHDSAPSPAPYVDGESEALVQRVRADSAQRSRQALAAAYPLERAARLAFGRLDAEQVRVTLSHPEASDASFLAHNPALGPIRARRVEDFAMGRILRGGGMVEWGPAVHALCALGHAGWLRRATATRALLEMADRTEAGPATQALLRIGDDRLLAPRMESLYSRWLAQSLERAALPYKAEGLRAHFALHPLATPNIIRDAVANGSSDLHWAMAREPSTRRDPVVRRALAASDDPALLRLLLEDAAGGDFEALFTRYVALDAGAALGLLFSRPEFGRRLSPPCLAPVFAAEDPRLRQAGAAALSVLAGASPPRGQDFLPAPVPALLGPGTRPSLEPGRLRRAMALLALPLSQTEYRVLGGMGEHYVQMADAIWCCSCPDFRRGVCKHIAAALLRTGDAEALAMREAERSAGHAVRGSFQAERRAKLPFR